MSGGLESSTLSVSRGPEVPDGDRRGPFLFLVLESHRPLAPPVRIALDDLDEVTIGRGAARKLEPARDAGVRRLDLRLDDPWLSSRHARVVRLLGRWVVEDSGSKNGSLVNGVPQRHAGLADGDLIELGRTFFIFRAALPYPPGAPPLFEAAPAVEAAPGLTSLLPALLDLFEQLAVVARSAIPVLLQGETGTGKEVMARAVHALSGRPGELVAVNCGALPRELVEGELFGHRKGAFSGATEDRPGLVRSADRGTLFLDEIGDLPAPAQAALLRVLQEQEVRPVGATRPVRVDLRVVAATHRPLKRLAALGEFRADLLARLSGYVVELPPLRERREDLGLLLGALLGRAAGDALHPRAVRVALHPRAARGMLMYGWPANVRELAQCVTTAVVLAQRGTIEPTHLPEAVARAAGGNEGGAREGRDGGNEGGGDEGREGREGRDGGNEGGGGEGRDGGDEDDDGEGGGDSGDEGGAGRQGDAPGDDARREGDTRPEDDARRRELVALLVEHRGNITAVARAAGKARMQIQRWLKRYRIDPEQFRR
ncbi:sigma 54-interacting transcriptional regulator [Sorangium sp. So ce1389]|uniref:sigma 54-interacting transcriptional regulator n=1 Tax=Sorangium sp. So ce1389 TaxID=3133336 RepID=UPI003F627370